nr:MAG TPA: hypothetical protein [Bacteriophage sp.]
MKNYRIYAEYNGRLELVDGNINQDNVMSYLDWLIVKEELPVVIVIEHDFEQDMDSVAYGYYGKIDTYLEMRGNALGGNYDKKSVRI